MNSKRVDCSIECQGISKCAYTQKSIDHAIIINRRHVYYYHRSQFTAKYLQQIRRVSINTRQIWRRKMNNSEKWIVFYVCINDVIGVAHCPLLNAQRSMPICIWTLTVTNGNSKIIWSKLLLSSPWYCIEVYCLALFCLIIVTIVVIVVIQRAFNLFCRFWLRLYNSLMLICFNFQDMATVTAFAVVYCNSISISISVRIFSSIMKIEHSLNSYSTCIFWLS